MPHFLLVRVVSLLFRVVLTAFRPLLSPLRYGCSNIGFLFGNESLLSTYGAEAGMLQDMYVAVKNLRNFAFRFVRSHGTNNSSTSRREIPSSREEIQELRLKLAKLVAGTEEYKKYQQRIEELRAGIRWYYRTTRETKKKKKKKGRFPDDSDGGTRKSDDNHHHNNNNTNNRNSHNEDATGRPIYDEFLDEEGHAYYIGRRNGKEVKEKPEGAMIVHVAQGPDGGKSDSETDEDDYHRKEEEEEKEDIAYHTVGPFATSVMMDLYRQGVLRDDPTIFIKREGESDDAYARLFARFPPPSRPFQEDQEAHVEIGVGLRRISMVYEERGDVVDKQKHRGKDGIGGGGGGRGSGTEIDSGKTRGGASTSESRIVVQITLPEEMMNLLPPSHQDTGAVVEVFPALFTQGINEMQTVANLKKSKYCRLQSMINNDGLSTLRDYFSRLLLSQGSISTSQEELQRMRVAIDEVEREISDTSCYAKHPRILMVAQVRFSPKVFGFDVMFFLFFDVFISFFYRFIIYTSSRTMSTDRNNNNHNINDHYHHLNIIILWCYSSSTRMQRQCAVRALHGGRAICCKSAKDRTGMSVTLEQTNHVLGLTALGISSHSRARLGRTWVLREDKDDESGKGEEPADGEEEEGGDGEGKTQRELARTRAALLDLFREHGVRLLNCFKNTHKRFYAFNQTIQRPSLPEEYRPPLSVCGHHVKT